MVGACGSQDENVPTNAAELPTQATHLSGLQEEAVQLSVVVFDLDGPGLAVVVILVVDVDDGRDHVREDLHQQQGQCK
jgi:hypothetical protein